MKMLYDQKRIAWLDIARTIAIIMVVLCHSIDQSTNVPGGSTPDGFTRVFTTVMYTVGRLGVPLFLFLSGCLLLSKRIDGDKDIFRFYKHNLLPLFIAFEVWILLYNLSWPLYNDGSFLKLSQIVKQLLFINNSPVGNMWYMPMILGLYIAVPFLSKIVQRFSLKSVAIPMSIAAIVFMLIPNFNTFADIIGIGKIGTVLDLSFLGGAYGLYLICGYYIGNGALKKVPVYILSVLCIVLFAFTCLFQIFAFSNGYPYSVWYNSFTLFLLSVALFEIFRRIKPGENSSGFLLKLNQEISVSSLGIFFIHRPLQKVLYSILPFNIVPKSLQILLMLAVSFIFSYLIVKLLSRIKPIRKWLFLIKDKQPVTGPQNAKS